MPRVRLADAMARCTSPSTSLFESADPVSGPTRYPLAAQPPPRGDIEYAPLSAPAALSCGRWKRQANPANENILWIRQRVGRQGDDCSDAAIQRAERPGHRCKLVERRFRRSDHTDRADQLTVRRHALIEAIETRRHDAVERDAACLDGVRIGVVGQNLSGEDAGSASVRVVSAAWLTVERSCRGNAFPDVKRYVQIAAPIAVLDSI